MILLVYISTLQNTHTQGATKTLLKEGAWKLKIFCLKNASTESQAEQSGATKSSHIDGDLGVKLLL